MDCPHDYLEIISFSGKILPWWIVYGKDLILHNPHKDCRLPAKNQYGRGFSMTKRDFAVRIASELRLNQAPVAEVVQKTLDYISDELAAGHTIELRNFGVFEVRVRNARKGRNPNKPENEVMIPERCIVKFRAGKELKDRVEQIRPEKLKR